MKRRQLLLLMSAVPVRGFAQRGAQPLIGFLDGKSRAAGQALTDAFLLELRTLGYESGRNIDVAYRFADGRDERLPALAKEIMALKPTVILAPGVNAAVAARTVTQSVPIVSWALADAVHLGLVASYARPGKNVTGIMPYVEGLPAKHLELAQKLVPGARRVGLFGNLNDPKAPPQQREIESAARHLKIQTLSTDLTGPTGIDAAMQQLARERADVVIVLETALTLSERNQIATAALANKLPSVYGYRENVAAGGLASYGVDLRWCARRAAAFVQKILQGAKPAELPVEFPTSLVTVLNLKTAKALGLPVAAALLAQANEVLE